MILDINNGIKYNSGIMILSKTIVVSGVGVWWVYYYTLDIVDSTDVTINVGVSSGDDEELMSLISRSSSSKEKYFSYQYNIPIMIVYGYINIYYY